MSTASTSALSSHLSYFFPLMWNYVYADTPQGTTLHETFNELRAYRDLLHLFHACINVYDEPSMEEPTSYIKRDQLKRLKYDALQTRMLDVRARLTAFLTPISAMPNIHAHINYQSAEHMHAYPMQSAVSVLNLWETPSLLNYIFTSNDTDAKNLIDCGADTNEQFFSGETTLEMAIQKELPTTVRALVTRNPTLLYQGNHATLLHRAAASTSSVILKFLLTTLWHRKELKKRLHVSDQLGLTPLTEALQLGHVKHVKLLLEANSRVDHVTGLGDAPTWPPIAYAVAHAAPHQSSPCLALLIEHRADVNMSIGPSATALTLSCHLGNLYVVKQLVTAGAKLHLEECKEEQQPIAFARKEGHDHIVNWIEPGKRPNKKRKSQAHKSVN